MNSTDNYLDLTKGFTPEGLDALKNSNGQSDAGFVPMSWSDYLAFLEEMKPQHIEVTAFDIITNPFQL